MPFLAFFVVLIPLVIIHELGHFFAAKSVRITVLEFGIGFPPRIAKLFTIGDTEYTLNWIPLGGFVRPYGEDFVRPKSEEEMQEDLKEIEGRHIENPKSVFEAGPWERIWFMFAGPLANFIAAIFFFMLIGLTGIPKTIGEVSLAEVFPGSPAAAAGLQDGDVVTHVDGVVVESVDEFADATEDKDTLNLTIKRGDETFDAVVTPSPFEGGGVEERVLVIEYLTDSPAGRAGVQLDDLIIALEGQPIKNVDDLREKTQAREGLETDYTILRGNESFVLTMTPVDIDGTARIGVTITGAPLDENIGAITANRSVEVKPEPADNVWEAFKYGLTSFQTTIETMFEVPSMLARGELSWAEARPVSIVGISQFGGEVIKYSQDEGVWYPILSLIGLISIALAVTNLLPIPGLDGGRILFVIIELLRGKPMEPEREGFVHMIGILFLLSLMVIVVFWDIIDPLNYDIF